MEPVSYDWWVPLPGIGYLRWDVALLGGLLELWILYRAVCCQQYWAIAFFLVLFLLVPHLPDSWPRYCMRPPELFQYIDTEDGSNFNVNNDGIAVLDGGLTRAQSYELANWVYQHSVNWTHASLSYALAYCQYGATLNFDRKEEDQVPWYSLRHGFGHTMTYERAARESRYRLHFPDHIAETQAQLRERVLPIVRPIYARAVNVSEEQIVFGDDYLQGLGLPSVGIMLPNIVWHWILNPHLDKLYGRRFDEMTRDVSDVCSGTQVQAFIMPLTVPYGAGLRQWNDPYHSTDVYYELGKIYNFNAKTVHAIRPLPYKEWRRNDIRMILQAFAIPCDDGRWIFFH